MAYDPVAPFMVVRTNEKRADKENNAYRFAVCLDGSDVALDALASATRFMDIEKDYIDMVHVEKMSIKAETVQADGIKRCEDLGIKHHSFHVIPFNADQDREDSILDHIHQEETPYVDFFVISNKGTGFVKHNTSRYLRRVAKGLIDKAKTNVILIV